MLNLKKQIKKIKKANKKNKKKNKIVRWVLTGLAIFYLASFALTFSAQPGQKEISISSALEKIKNNEVAQILVTENNVQLQLKNEEIVYTQKEPNVSFTEILEGSNIDPTTVNVKVDNQNLMKTVANIIGTIGPIILTGVFIWFIYRGASKAQSGIFSFGKSKAKYFKKNGKATFDDVAGLKEAKEELKEVVDFLKNPKKYEKMGARTPKGVLLVGPSGTGKTLMARAVAGEAKVPFLHMAGSEFMEMLVGIGASRVRDLFQTAQKAQKAIIFIDEIDAIGGIRGGGGMGPGHGEREQTLNQLLVEMDGLEPNETIVVLAATNRPDILDPALTRPGRFDRRIMLGMPDLQEREKILELHAKGKPFGNKVEWNKIARRTVGFSGADLENMLNEAAILAARLDKKEITPAELEEAAIKVKMGPEKKRLVTEDEKKVSAYHEAGHALVSHYTDKTDPVEKISIVSRGMALGFTLMPPERDRVHEDKTRLISRITTLMGGRAAEELVFQEMTSGASQDIKHASQIARKMVVELGMSNLGPMYYGPQINRTEWGQTYSKPEEISPETKAEIDSEVKKIINQAYKNAEKLLKKHRKTLDQIANKLLEKETLEREEFENIISSSQH